MTQTKENITEALYEIITGLHGFDFGDTASDKDFAEKKMQWERQAKTYLKKMTGGKNISLDKSSGTITLEGTNGRILHTITIN